MLKVKGESASERMIVLYPYTTTLISYQIFRAMTYVRLRDIDGKEIRRETRMRSDLIKKDPYSIPSRPHFLHLP